MEIRPPTPPAARATRVPFEQRISFRSVGSGSKTPYFGALWMDTMVGIAFICFAEFYSDFNTDSCFGMEVVYVTNKNYIICAKYLCNLVYFSLNNC